MHVWKAESLRFLMMMYDTNIFDEKKVCCSFQVENWHDFRDILRLVTWMSSPREVTTEQSTYSSI